MKQSLHDYMRVGIVHFMAYPFAMSGEGPIADSVAKIVCDEFFESIEVTHVDVLDEHERVKNLLTTSGVRVGFGAQPFILRGKLDLNSPDPEKRQQAIDVLKGAVDQAYAFGARKFGFLSGPRPQAKEQQEKALELLAESITEIGRYAQSKGDLMLSLETFDDSTDKRALIGSNRLAVELAQEVRKSVPSFGLMIDLSHLPMQTETIHEALHVSADYINHAHIGTCVINDPTDPAFGDKHPYFGHPKGECKVPEVREFLRGLLENGYLVEDAADRNIVAFEVQPLGEQTSEAVIADAKRTLREAWRTL